MTKIKILIVEDEKITAMVLETLLTNWDYSAKIALSSAEATQLFIKEKYDLLLLDIRLGEGKNGIDLAQEFTKIRATPIVFMTSSEDMEEVQRAIATSPAAYIFKPIDQRALQVNIELALHNFYKTNNTTDIGLETKEDKYNARFFLKNGDIIFLKQSYHFVKLPIQDIICLETENNYTTIITEKQKFVVRLGLSTVLEQLNAPFLIRVNRAQAINIKQVLSFNDIEVKITNKKELTLSKGYKEQFMAKFEAL